MDASSGSGIDLLEVVAAALAEKAPVTVGTMFRSPGIRSGTKIVAFLGHGGRLIVKVPHARVVALIETGEGEAVTMGARMMREWVALPPSAEDDQTLERWIPLASEALEFVGSA